MLNYSQQNQHWYLEGKTNQGKKWVIPVDKNPFIIGRNAECNLSILSKTVSRRHAEIMFQSSSLLLHDLESTNGTFVNNKRIKNIVSLNSGDTIYFGDIQFRIFCKDDTKKEIGSGTMHMNIPEKEKNFTAYYDLTKREEEILYHLIQGQSTKKIAETLFISFGTAKNHVTNIFKKTGVHSRYELISLFNNFSVEKREPF